MEKKTSELVDIPELYASNIFVELIKESLDLTVYTIIDEENIMYSELKELNKEINVNERTSLDLLFIMDISCSMNPYLDQVKNSILNIIYRITLECPGIDINIGYIGYIENYLMEHYVNIEFTNDYQYLENTIRNVNTQCNNDDPEDMAWGMERALEKDWKSNARFAILFADFPCHGSKYHSPYLSENYPNGDPNRTNIEESIKNLAEINVSLFCTKITSNTDIMFPIFENIYNDYPKCQFKVIPLTSAHYLSDTVVDSAAEVYISHRNNDIT